MKKLTLYAHHAITYGEGCGSDMCKSATRICLGRGRVPCDILFIGEAPGESEDVIGLPFVGPAGRLLDHIIDMAIGRGEDRPRLAFTNLVGCLPRENGTKSGAPEDDQVRSCQFRLQDFVKIASPRLIVCVGNLSRDWLDVGYRSHIRLHADIPRVAITHPAAILRANIAQKGLLAQRATIVIRNAVEEYVVENL